MARHEPGPRDAEYEPCARRSSRSCSARAKENIPAHYRHASGPHSSSAGMTRATQSRHPNANRAVSGQKVPTAHACGGRAPRCHVDSFRSASKCAHAESGHENSQQWRDREVISGEYRRSTLPRRHSGVSIATSSNGAKTAKPPARAPFFACFAAVPKSRTMSRLDFEIDGRVRLGSLSPRRRLSRVKGEARYSKPDLPRSVERRRGFLAPNRSARGCCVRSRTRPRFDLQIDGRGVWICRPDIQFIRHKADDPARARQR